MRVIVNGTFDIIHPGHIKLLNYAKSLGDHLLVAIDTDDRVRSLKGANRPINSQDDRKFLLENLKAVDQVVIFNSNDELLSYVKQCDLMVKGSDYKDKIILETGNIDIVFYDRTKHSTTQAIQDIINR